MTDRHDNLERLLQHAAEADRFAQWVGDADAPSRPERGSSSLRWWIGGSAAAAAAVAMGFVFMRPAPAPVAPRPIAITPSPTRHVEIPSAPVAAPTFTPTFTLASVQPDLSDWFHLAPDAEDGIPSLTDERSVLLAVYQGQDTTCGCLSWRLADDARFKQAKATVLNDAIASPCREGADGVTVYAVSGPRYLLPFHEEDAQRLAQCLATQPEQCTTPEAELDRIADAAGDATLSDLAASALAMCVPSGLKVTSVTMPLSLR
jgi:hypothetical protein